MDGRTLPELVGIVTGIIVTILTLILVIPVLREWRERRKLALEFGADFFPNEDILNATRCYVRPDCSRKDLGEIRERKRLIPQYDERRMDLFSEIDRFCRPESSHRHLLLLADSGMGKTSFLMNYYIFNSQRRHKNQYRIAIIPLGHPQAMAELRKIDRKRETVLFLDAFDEDREAFRDYRARLDTLMNESSLFRRVLITARTQFFPRDDEIPSQTGIVSVAPHRLNGHIYEFAKLYLAPLSDEQVDDFLHRRYGFSYVWPKKEIEETGMKRVERLLRRYRFSWRRREREKARAVVNQIPLLSIRPLLLAYIPDVLDKASRIRFSYQLYELVVDYWYEVEAAWWGGKDPIRQFSEEVAVELYRSFLDAGADRMQKEDVVRLARAIQISVDEWKTTARSLLNRDADGNYKFAHRSIMEYLFVKKFAEGDARCCGIRWTDQMKKFMLEMISSDRESGTFAKLQIRGADLEEAHFSADSLRGLYLPGSNLTKAVFPRGCDLQDANLCESNLEKVSIYRANLTGANLSKAILRKANLRFANLTKGNLDLADLEGADLASATLMEAVLTAANLQGCNLQGARCRGVDLEKANLRGALLGDAGNLSADFTNASFRDANLTDAILDGVKMQGAILTGATVNLEQIKSAHTDAYTIFDPEFAASVRGGWDRPSDDHIRWVQEILGRVQKATSDWLVRDWSDTDWSIIYEESTSDGKWIKVRGDGRWEIRKRDQRLGWQRGSVESNPLLLRELAKTLLDLIPWDDQKGPTPKWSKPHASLTVQHGGARIRFWEYDDPPKNAWLVKLRDRVLEWPKTSVRNPQKLSILSLKRLNHTESQD